MTDAENSLRETVLELLRGGGAHLSLSEIVRDWPWDLQGAHADGVSYTPWQLLEHVRIAQWDIVEFTRDAGHESPPWPDGYWPDGEAPPDAEAWAKSAAAIESDLNRMQDIVADRDVELAERIPHGSGQTYLREALLVADHNAYHGGQLMVLRKMLEKG
jgi:hypothetical protein